MFLVSLCAFGIWPSLWQCATGASVCTVDFLWVGSGSVVYLGEGLGDNSPHHSESFSRKDWITDLLLLGPLILSSLSWVICPKNIRKSLLRKWVKWWVIPSWRCSLLYHSCCRTVHAWYDFINFHCPFYIERNREITSFFFVFKYRVFQLNPQMCQWCLLVGKFKLVKLSIVNVNA